MPFQSEKKIIDMPVGPGHDMEEKLSWATFIFDSLGNEMKNDPTISRLLNDYREKIRETWRTMKEYGVVEECTRCALQDGGSCCGQGIENKFDVVTLLVNLLLGVNLPRKPWDPTGCWFLGPRGCLLEARHVICVNFICKRLYASVSGKGIMEVQKAMQAETDTAFVLEEYLKGWLIRHE